MPNVVCPTCGITLSVSDEMVGNQVQCGGCQQIFLAEAPKPKPKPAPSRDDDEDDRRDRPSRRRDRRDDDDEDDRPSRRRSRREDDDGDEYADRRRRRSRPRRYDDDDDYYDDRPIRSGGGMAVTGMILGIIAITVEVPAIMITAFDTVFCCGVGSLFTWPIHVIGAALGITGLILGAMGMKKKEGKGMATAGVATSVAALVLALISAILMATNQAAWQRRLNNVPMIVPPNNNNRW